MEDDLTYPLESDVQPHTKQISLHYDFQTRPELKGTALSGNVDACAFFVRRIFGARAEGFIRHCGSAALPEVSSK